MLFPKKMTVELIDQMNSINQVQRFVHKEGALDRMRENLSWYPDGSFYKPISINITGSNYCPIGCGVCGIDSQNSRQNASQITETDRVRLLHEAADIGVVSYLGSIGDGEPFTAQSMRFFKTAIGEMRGKLDLTKINTSAVTFVNVDSAKRQLSNLQEWGWSNTSYFTPVLAISLGMQQDRNIPINRVVNGIIAAREVFAPGEITTAISHYYMPSGDKRYANLLTTLSREYEKRTGRILNEDVIVKSAPLQDAGPALHGGMDGEFPTVRIKDLPDMHCYQRVTDEFLEPVIRVDVNGNIYSCAAFNLESPAAGNVTTMSLREAVLEINSREYFKAVAVAGSKFLQDLAEHFEPGVTETPVTNWHMACRIVRETLERHPEWTDIANINLQSQDLPN